MTDPQDHTDHRDHTVCGICDVSFYVCQRYRTDPRILGTDPGMKHWLTAYDGVNISRDEIIKNNDVQVLVKKPAMYVQPVVGGYDLPKSRHEDEEHFLTYSFPIGNPGYGTSCVTSLTGGQRFGMSAIKMCSHEYGECVDSFEPQRAWSAVGVPFHWTCLRIFKRVSLHKYGRIIWAGLYELGMQKNHAGFKNIERDVATEMNHGYLHIRRENIWLHKPGTEWVVASPFVAQYSTRSSYYPSPLAGPDPREQVFSGDYRRAVGSIGQGAYAYWGPRIATWRNPNEFRVPRPHSKRTQKEVGFITKKPRLSAPSAPASTSSLVPSAATPSITPSGPPTPSVPSTTTTTTLPTTTPGRDLISLIAPETLLQILTYLPSPLDLANLRLVSRKFAEIPMSHFRARLYTDMPWAFEIFDPNGVLLPPPAGMKIDYKEMYRLVRRTAGTGLGAIKGMRNRRRIWESCWAILGEVERRME